MKISNGTHLAARASSLLERIREISFLSFRFFFPTLNHAWSIKATHTHTQHICYCCCCISIAGEMTVVFLYSPTMAEKDNSQRGSFYNFRENGFSCMVCCCCCRLLLPLAAVSMCRRKKRVISREKQAVAAAESGRLGLIRLFILLEGNSNSRQLPPAPFVRERTTTKSVIQRNKRRRRKRQKGVSFLVELTTTTTTTCFFIS